MSEQKTFRADVKLVLQAALLVLGTGLTLLAGWAMGGAPGLVLAVVCAVMFFFLWHALRDKTGPTRREITWLAIGVGIVLIQFLTHL